MTPCLRASGTIIIIIVIIIIVIIITTIIIIAAECRRRCRGMCPRCLAMCPLNTIGILVTPIMTIMMIMRW